MSPLAFALWCVVTAPAVLLAMVGWRARSDTREAIARDCHELRGPITAARLGLQLASRTGELSPERLRAIDQELGRAGLALDDLTVARGRPRRPREVESVDVGDLLRDSVEALRPAAQASRASVRLLAHGQRAQVWGDRLRLAQVTGNLIANAIEHGGGAIDVKQVTESERVRIEVTDDGPGLRAPVAELARRARRRDSRRGHGLVIASAIAAEHHGRLSAAPSERGARLVLELPLTGTRLAPAVPKPEMGA